jgi:hypothetical protein
MDGGDANDIFLLLDAVLFLGYVATNFQTLVTQLTSPMAAELEPGSAFFDGSNGINIQSNLDREATSMTSRRFALVSHAPSYGQLCSSWTGGAWQSCQVLLDALAYYYMERYFYYAYYSDQSDPHWLAKRNNAWKWSVGSQAFSSMNGVWCNLIGATLIAGGCDADGFIPAVKQHWPGATNIQIGSPSVPGPAHGDEPADFVVRSTMKDLLASAFGVVYVP